MADVVFDLLGDPVPEGYEGVGRPPHVVTERNRNKIMLLLAMGWANKRIAAAIGVDVKTLRKHYSRELRTREVALDRARAGHLTLLWDEATKGNVAALKEIGKAIAKIEALTFGEMPAVSDRHAPRPQRQAQPVPGKKEAAKLAAKSAGIGTDWGNDLLPPTMN